MIFLLIQAHPLLSQFPGFFSTFFFFFLPHPFLKYGPSSRPQTHRQFPPSKQEASPLRVVGPIERFGDGYQGLQPFSWECWWVREEGAGGSFTGWKVCCPLTLHGFLPHLVPTQPPPLSEAVYRQIHLTGCGLTLLNDRWSHFFIFSRVIFSFSQFSYCACSHTVKNLRTASSILPCQGDAKQSNFSYYVCVCAYDSGRNYIIDTKNGEGGLGNGKNVSWRSFNIKVVV